MLLVPRVEKSLETQNRVKSFNHTVSFQQKKIVKKESLKRKLHNFQVYNVSCGSLHRDSLCRSTRAQAKTTVSYCTVDISGNTAIFWARFFVMDRYGLNAGFLIEIIFVDASAGRYEKQNRPLVKSEVSGDLDRLSKYERNQIFVQSDILLISYLHTVLSFRCVVTSQCACDSPCWDPSLRDLWDLWFAFEFLCLQKLLQDLTNATKYNKWTLLGTVLLFVSILYGLIWFAP